MGLEPAKNKFTMKFEKFFFRETRLKRAFFPVMLNIINDSRATENKVSHRLSVRL